MKPYLEKKGMSDEELFEKLNVCFSNEMERSQKFGSQLTPKVNAVQEGGDKQAKKNTEVEQALMKELRELNREFGPHPKLKLPHTAAYETTSTV